MATKESDRSVGSAPSSSGQGTPPFVEEHRRASAATAVAGKGFLEAGSTTTAVIFLSSAGWLTSGKLRMEKRECSDLVSEVGLNLYMARNN